MTRADTGGAVGRAAGWRTVMEAGGGVKIDSGESLYGPQGTPLFQLPRVERGTPDLLAPENWFLWE